MKLLSRSCGVSIPVFHLLLWCLVSNAQETKRLVQDSIVTAIEPGYNNVSSTHRLFLGDNYRRLWATPVKIRVFHLNQEKRGLRILQRGGGMQSKSLRMQTANGQQWVIRTIQKYPESVLPPSLRQTVVKDILQDQISAEHPFSALTVPPLAQALGIPHAHPEIVYVPDDEALGKYRKDFANQVFLFEEREPLDADKTDNTVKAQSRLQKDNDNRIDQRTVLRARLLDMLLGDWDRHEDQWRWQRTEDSIGTHYEPVPRDRDQVFYKTSGIIPWAVSRHLLMAKFQGYDDHIRSISRWNLNARNFDRYFLNELSWDDWDKEIKYVQQQLTDAVISNAIKQMPDAIYQLCGTELTRKFISRRDKLEKQALNYYRFLSNTVDIPASDKREKIQIAYQPDQQVKVTVQKLKKNGNTGDTTYQRIFKPDITHEIRVYGFDGNDVFEATGSRSSPITVRLIGGKGEDKFLVDSTLHGKGKRYVYDRSDEKNILPAANQAHILTSTDSTVNEYNSLGFVYNFLQPLLLASYNKDYGFQFIGNFIYQKQGFRKSPYASRQSLLVNYGFKTNSLLLNYNGEFKQAINKTDLLVDVFSKGPNYTSNFFGVGNNTAFVNAGNQRIHYYRNVYNYVAADIRLKHQYGYWAVNGGPAAQYYNGDPDDNENRFLSSYNLQHPAEKVFSTQTYAGIVGGFSLDTRNKSLVPRTGIYWNTNVTGMQGLNMEHHTYGQITSEFSLYLYPTRDSAFVIANRIGGGTSAGNPTYYQQLKLGGSQNLRGFYYGRFTGKTMAFNNLELRLKLFDFTSYLLPGSFGLIGFNDVGRVWSPGESSTQWHDGYGGGFYLIPAQLILIQTVVGFSKEGTYPYISAGFRF